MSVISYTKTGNKATTVAKLPKEIFALEVSNHQLLKDAYLSYLAAGRVNHAKVKNRGDVSGGGIKPWRQKGTGRARFGSSRNPIWTGGGVAFGPTGNENYVRKMSTATKRLALRQALSFAATDNKLMIIDNFDFSSGKVKVISNLLTKIGVKKPVLLVTDDKSDMSVRSTKNLTDVKVISTKYLNVFDILNANQIIITNPALDSISDWLKPSKKVEK